MSKLKHLTKFNLLKIMKTALLLLMICFHQNKKAILICFLQEGDTVKLIYAIILKAISISPKIQFELFLI